MQQRKNRIKKTFSPGAFSPIARRVTIGQIAFCVVAVVFMIFANVFYNKSAVATRSLDKMAEDYYENYFYDKFLNGKTASKEVFGAYITAGFPTVTLRQLLTFDESRNADYEADFYYCEKKSTTIKITPTEPFGRKDYTVEANLDCEF